MKVFNKDKALRQIKLKQNKNTYIKKVSIVLSCFILLIGIMYFTFAKFEQNSEEYTLINGVVKYGGSGDIQLSYVVDGVSQSTPPAKGTGYKLKNYECTNADAVWDNSTWRISIGEMTGKVKCNLEFETATSVNVTMYGPPGAVISYTDSLGSHTQTMDSTGKKENVEIGIMNNITFEDTTVAKDPNNLANNYTKTINVTEDITDVYVMPDNALYWFGNNVLTYTKCNGGTGGYQNAGTPSVVENTTFLRIGGTYLSGSIGYKDVNMSNYNSFKAIGYVNTSGIGGSGSIFVGKSNSLPSISAYSYDALASFAGQLSTITTDVSFITGERAIGCSIQIGGSGTGIDLYALWLE